jgi:hypothetical protein
MDAYDSYDELMEDSDREDGDYDPLNQVAFMPEQGLVKGALKPYRTAQVGLEWSVLLMISLLNSSSETVFLQRYES